MHTLTANRYALSSVRVNESPGGYDCFADLHRDGKQIGRIDYYGSQGAGPVAYFISACERDAFERQFGVGLDQETAIYRLFAEAGVRV